MEADKDEPRRISARIAKQKGLRLWVEAGRHAGRAASAARLACLATRVAANDARVDDDTVGAGERARAVACRHGGVSARRPRAGVAAAPARNSKGRRHAGGADEHASGGGAGDGGRGVGR